MVPDCIEKSQALLSFCPSTSVEVHSQQSPGCRLRGKPPTASIVSIRPTTGIKPLYTTIATVTMNLIVSAAIVLLNPYVTIYISYKIPPFALSVHIPDVSASTCVEADPKVSHELHSCDKAFGRLHHSGNSLGLHRVPYK